MRHFNPSISEDASRIFNCKGEYLEEIGDEIIPVVVVERYANIVREAEGAGTGTVTAYTTPADKDFFLTGFNMNYSTDAACDTTSLSVQVFIEGVSRLLIRRKKITLTAASETVVREFSKPIKIDRNTAITLVCSFAAGNCPRSLTICGYTVETVKGV